MKETLQIIGIVTTFMVSSYTVIFGTMHLAEAYFGKGDYLVGLGILCALGCFLMTMYVHHRYERYCWNDGICRECGEDWNYAWTDSGMNNAYKCANGHTEIVHYTNAKCPPRRIHLK